MQVLEFDSLYDMTEYIEALWITEPYFKGHFDRTDTGRWRLGIITDEQMEFDFGGD